MKLKRLFAISLSLAMTVTMISALVSADETDTETTETTLVETTETKEKETEKPAAKETEEPSETEDKKPEETEPSETNSSESEEPGPSEPEETQMPDVKEDKAPDAGNAVSKTPKAAATIPEMKYQITNDGMLVWEPVDGAPYIYISIEWKKEGRNIPGTSLITGDNSCPFNLVSYIDGLIMDTDSRVSESAQSDTHYFTIAAFTDTSFKTKLARSEFVFKYKSPKKPVTAGTISNVRFSAEGVIEWDPYPGTEEYVMSIEGYNCKCMGTKCDLNAQIDFLIKNWSSFKVKDSYNIVIMARIQVGKSNVTIAKWSGRYPQATNPMTVSPKTAKVKYKKLRKKKQTVARSKVINVSNAQGKVTYKLISVKRGKSKKYKKYFKINSATGNVTIKKKLKKGTYKITCNVTAAGDISYKGAAKTVTFTIKVK